MLEVGRFKILSLRLGLKVFWVASLGLKAWGLTSHVLSSGFTGIWVWELSAQDLGFHIWAAEGLEQLPLVWRFYSLAYEDVRLQHPLRVC